VKKQPVSLSRKYHAHRPSRAPALGLRAEKRDLYYADRNLIEGGFHWRLDIATAGLRRSVHMSLFWIISLVALWLLVLCLAFLLLGALRALGLLRWRLEQLEATMPSRLGRSGLKPGKKAPAFTLPSVTGGEISQHDFAGRKVLLVFMQPGCGPCHAVTPELNRLQEAGEVQVVVVQNADLEKVRKWADEHRPRFPVAVQDRLSLSKRYEAFATPFAFLIDERGVIASRGIAGSKQYLGYILSRAGSKREDTLEEDSTSGEERDNEADSLTSLPSSNSKGVHHV
jgi:methylamine dehydrogenase accessory protein MauD